MFALFSLLLFGCSNTQLEDDTNSEYEIRFLSEGVEIAKYNVKKGELITPPENPTKENYTFSHWSTHESSTDGSEKFDFSTPINSHMTFFAHFNYTPKVDKSNNDLYGYERIYKEYSDRLQKECPVLSLTECAEIANEGISKMAEYMYKASGTDGQYATYEKWASKLTNVYTNEAR